MFKSSSLQAFAFLGNFWPTHLRHTFSNRFQSSSTPTVLSSAASSSVPPLSSTASEMSSKPAAPTPDDDVLQQQGWSLLGCPRSELSLDFTLPTGQSFRWKEIAPGEYLGVVGSRAVLLRQLDDDVAFKVLSRAKGTDASPEADIEALSDYFNLPVALTTLAKEWCQADPYFDRLSAKLPGARMLRQDPVECLFSFICSQNNHISRIHGMVTKLCERFGSALPLPALEPLLSSAPLATAATAAAASGAGGGAKTQKVVPLPTQLHAFPTLEELASAQEDELREAGFGYRARYIVGAVAELADKPGGGVAWLASLRKASFDAAVEELCTLPGVGPKVAACVALFSLDKHSSIPVDTHVWQLAIRQYTPHLRGKTLSPKFHAEVQAAFVNKFGAYAGWAHNTLFIAELASVKARLREMASVDAFGTEEEEEGFTSVSEASSQEEESDAVDEYLPPEAVEGDVSARNVRTRRRKLYTGTNVKVEPDTPPLSATGGRRKRPKASDDRV